MAKVNPSKGHQSGRPVRCAIYTRKSSEEGLEQDFNSLQAQREACEAYIKSQKHEGWLTVPERYDDGGISGATMDRPALRQLLADIAAGKVDTVVVYKVDRLTRTLSDFAKIVEIFDARGVAFVSITQQFNTTTSMGRLTLNVLLSFAQFEREVTGERIRDKIAASKKKGMWMGGTPPLGYDARDRKLVVNEAQAETVRHIFQRYVALGSVRLLQQELADSNITSKVWVSVAGRHWGGHPLARGALYLILKNRLYLGEIVHKEFHYPGAHPAIVDRELWDRAQILLNDNGVDRPEISRPKNASLLAGLIYDADGNRMTPTHAVKNGKRYRYYVSQSKLGDGEDATTIQTRLPAAEIERLVTDRLRALLTHEAVLFDLFSGVASNTQEQKRWIAKAAVLAASWPSLLPTTLACILSSAVLRVLVNGGGVVIELRPCGLRAIAAGQAVDPPVTQRTIHDEAPIILSVPAELLRVGYGAKLVVAAPGGGSPEPNAALIKLLAKAHDLWRKLLQGRYPSLVALAEEEGLTGSYLLRLVRNAWLAPDITHAILAGTQPPTLSVVKLMQSGLVPADWQKQRAMFGFA